jgi:hypothetical protein
MTDDDFQRLRLSAVDDVIGADGPEQDWSRSQAE